MQMTSCLPEKLCNLLCLGHWQTHSSPKPLPTLGIFPFKWQNVLFLHFYIIGEMWFFFFMKGICVFSFLSVHACVCSACINWDFFNRKWQSHTCLQWEFWGTQLKYLGKEKKCNFKGQNQDLENVILKQGLSSFQPSSVLLNSWVSQDGPQ